VKYMLLICWDRERMEAQGDPTPAEVKAADEEKFDWADELDASGIRITGDRLAPPGRAQTVRVRDGKTVVTDGPFTETKEAVGGFDLLECDSLEEAVEIAARHPVAQTGAVEVRPFWGH
jgi:hypothetical protein